MRRGVRILVGALLGLVLTAGLLVGVSSAASADTTDTGWIGGLVTTSDGKPAVGALATLYTIDADRQRTTVTSAVTRSDGKFWLDYHPVGSYYLLVTDPTGEDAATWWPTPSGPYQPDPFDLTTDDIYAQITMTPGLDISGKVTFDGKPVADVWVCAGADIACPQTDASGAYTIRGIAAGLHQLVADPGAGPYVMTFFPSYTRAWSEVSGPQLIDETTAAQSWDFELAAVPYVGGTVVNEAGAPIAAARVCLSSLCDTTGADGVFRIDVDLPFHYFPSLVITAAGYQDGSLMIGANQHEASVTLTATKPVGPTKVTSATPSISGKAKVGSRLTARPGAWGPDGVALRYQWYRNGTKIKGATKATYKLTWRDARKKMSVKVTGRLDGYLSASTVSKRTKKVTWR